MYRIIKICEDIKEDIYTDTLPKDYYFEIKYEDKVIISLVKIYANHDENDRIRHEKVYGKVEELHMTLKEYCNLLIMIYEWKLMIGASGDIRTEEIVKRIKIQKIN